FSSRRRHTRFSRDWSSDVCSSDLEDVRVVLGKVAHSQKAMERPTRLAAVKQPRLEVTNREITVGVGPQREELAVPGAVHRLEPRSEERRVGKEGRCGSGAEGCGER